MTKEDGCPFSTGTIKHHTYGNQSKNCTEVCCHKTKKGYNLNFCCHKGFAFECSQVDICKEFNASSTRVSSEKFVDLGTTSSTFRLTTIRSTTKHAIKPTISNLSEVWKPVRTTNPVGSKLKANQKFSTSLKFSTKQQTRSLPSTKKIFIPTTAFITTTTLVEAEQSFTTQQIALFTTINVVILLIILTIVILCLRRKRRLKKQREIIDAQRTDFICSIQSDHKYSHEFFNASSCHQGDIEVHDSRASTLSTILKIEIPQFRRMWWSVCRIIFWKQTHAQSYSHVTIHDRKPVGQGNYGEVFFGKLYYTDTSKAPVQIAIKYACECRVCCVVKGKTQYSENKQPSVKQSCSTDMLIRVSSELEELVDSNILSKSALIFYAFQIANGMQFLSEKQVIHRDLALRNVLLTHNHIVKINDFGLAHFGTEYSAKNPLKPLPTRWLAPESISVNQKFTTKSDVWSYGVTLWELFSLAENLCEYAAAPNGREQFEKWLLSGNRFSVPELAGDEIKEIIHRCWLLDPLSRPPFYDICLLLLPIVRESNDFYDYLCKIRA